MSFAVNRINEDGFSQVVIENTRNKTQVIILPEFGALLHGLVVETVSGPFNIIDNYSEKSTLVTELESSFKGSKLSPFPCRIPLGIYEYAGKEFMLQNRSRDGAAIHGLLYNKGFKVSDEYCDEIQGSVTLKYNYNRDDTGYPYKYRCEVRYSLAEDNILAVYTTIINLDESAIPLADGWHPYFRLSGRVNDWMLRLNTSSMVELNEALVPTGRLTRDAIFAEEELVGDTVLDNCFIVDFKDNYAACTLYNPQNGLSVSFFPDASYPYLLIYTPPHRQSIAIENLSAAPNCFNNKLGLIELAPGHSKTFTIHYKVNQE